ncbi:N-acetylmuramoyl-L-alanine amidase [Candidatus Gracilibacteria bacterium]|nr:N-acetylmuramoyl-L-alanine amidase [Candidatus Gracilibacteria bacterium]
MKKLISILLIILPLHLISNFEYNNCGEETIFYVNEINYKKASLSSFYCDFGRVKEYQVKINNSKKGNFVFYDQKNKTLNPISKTDLLSYVKRLKIDLENIKDDEITKDKIGSEYIKNYRDHLDVLSNFYKNSIFSKKELVKIIIEINKEPYKIFEKTFGDRLLMNGEIISREEWGADESFSNPEIYMKGCEDGSCIGGPIAKNQLKDNYLKYFNEIDKKNVKIKSFTDGRDNLKYYPVDRIIIHHTASKYVPNKEEGIKYMQSLQKYHALTLRWGDIGYHYLIDGEGNIYEGRAGGKYVLGAHVATHNYGSVGISLMSDGYYSDKMLESLKKLTIYLGKEYDLDLTKKTTTRNNDLTGYGSGWAIVAHKELDSRKPLDPEINMDLFRSEIASIVLKNKVVKK